MALNRPPSLEDRIAVLRDEIDALVDARAGEIAKTCPGVPIGVIRSLTTKHSQCRCAVYLDLKAADDQAAARAADAEKGAAA